MARPAHPDSHDERLRAILDIARNEEYLVPCPDKATAILMRSRFREIIRAHKEWSTGKFDAYKGIRFKILMSHEVLPSRPNYDINPHKFPFTLSLDSREIMDEILPYAGLGGSSVPFTRAPTKANDAEQDTYESDDDSFIDDYDRILNNTGRS